MSWLKAIKRLRPNYHVAIYGNDYESIDWGAETPIPKGSLQAEITALEAEEAVEQAALQEIEGDNDAIKNTSAIRALVTARPAQIDNWIDNNVTDINSTKQVLKILAKAVSYFAKKSFR